MTKDYPFLNDFDGLLISGEDKLIKPDPAIYQLAIKRFNLKPKECVFIDDKIENIDAAKKLNFRTIHLINPKNIRTDIENRTPGGFYLGPKDDEKAFVPVGKSGWEQRDGSGEVLATYNSVSELIKSGLKTSDVGFRSLITMDVDSDGTPDGPARLDFVENKYYDLIDKK
jgi:hypothetical protein